MEVSVYPKEEKKQAVKKKERLKILGKRTGKKENRVKKR